MAQGNVYGGKFCNPNEQRIVTIGTGYIANFLSGAGAERAGATLTNKRVYFSGKVFSFNERGGLSSLKQRKIVNVRDITGVGYLQYEPYTSAIVGIIALFAGIAGFIAGLEPVGASGLVVSVASIFFYFQQRTTLLTIEYAGGNIAFDTRWLQTNEEDIFIRNIHLAKDKLYSVSAVEQGFTGGGGRYDDEIPDL